MGQVEVINSNEVEQRDAVLAIEAGREELSRLELDLAATVERMLDVARGIGEAKRAAGLGVVDLTKEQVALVRIKDTLTASGMPPQRSMQVATAIVLTRREVQLKSLASQPINNAE